MPAMATAERVTAAGGRTRSDISDALGVKRGAGARGELKYEGPDGVYFDLSVAGFWQLQPADAPAEVAKAAVPT